MMYFIAFSFPFFASSFFGLNAGLIVAMFFMICVFVYNIMKYEEYANELLGNIEVDQAEEDSIEDCEELHYVSKDV